MELSSTRKLLAVIISAVIAFSTALTAVSLIAGSTLGTRDFFLKNTVTGEMVSQCEEQLSAKYAALEAESGIPAAVFETVKLEYPVNSQLKIAFQNNFGSDNPELYNDALVKHFEKLCADYLDGNEISYKKEYIRNTAEEAAKIYSDTVGLHNMGSQADKIKAVKSLTSVTSIIGIAALAISITLLAVLFSKRKRAYPYLFGAVTGGAGGTALAAILLRFISPLRHMNIAPAVYKNAMIHVLNKELLMLAAFSVLIAGVSFASAVITQLQIDKKKK